MGPVTTQFAKLDPGPSEKFGAISFLVTAIGTALVVVAFTVVNWFRGNDSSHFRDVHRVLVDSQGFGAHPQTVAKLYFNWLGWVLLAVLVILAVLAATPTISGPFRIVAPVVAAGAVVVSVLAVNLFVSSDVSLGIREGFTYWLKAARVGLYLAVAGFLAIGVGAALGPGREHD